MNSIRQIQKLNERELENSVCVWIANPEKAAKLDRSPSASWHTDYRDTAYVFIGGLSFDLTERDIITIFSQFGEPVWLKLARDGETGRSKGFAFLKYEDQRSTDLAVDNLGGATVLGRVLRVDHTRYKKRDDDDDEQYNIAVAPESQDLPENRGAGGVDKLLGAESPRRKAPRDAITQEHEEEDPMREYIAQERRERVDHRHGSKEDGSKEHRHHHHRRHRHRSRER